MKINFLSDPDAKYPFTILGASSNSWRTFCIRLNSGDSKPAYECHVASTKNSMTQEEKDNALKSFSGVGVDLSTFQEVKHGDDCLFKF